MKSAAERRYVSPQLAQIDGDLDHRHPHGQIEHREIGRSLRKTSNLFESRRTRRPVGKIWNRYGTTQDGAARATRGLNDTRVRRSEIDQTVSFDDRNEMRDDIDGAVDR